MHEGSHQEGGLGGARANAGGDGYARHRQLRVLLAVKAVLATSGGGIHPLAALLF